MSKRRSALVSFAVGGLGAFGIAVACFMLLGLGPNIPTSLNMTAERLRQLTEQLARTEEDLAAAQLLQEFWERESTNQEALMAQYGPLMQNDHVTPMLYDRAKQLAYRCGYQIQDSRLRVAQLTQRVAILRAQVAGP